MDTYKNLHSWIFPSLCIFNQLDLQIVQQEKKVIWKLRLLPRFEPEGGELEEAADVAARVEPLEEAPEEADPKVLEEPTDLLPVVVKVERNSESASAICF